MTLPTARVILGLGPNEDPRPYLREFRVVRERLAELVRNAPTPELAERYQQGLLDMDRALAAVRESLEPVDLPTPSPVAAPAPAAAAAPAVSPRRWLLPALVCLCLALLAGVGAGWYHWQRLETVRIASLDRAARTARLERDAAEHLLNRRWPEASAAYDEIARQAPGAASIPQGRRRIEAGMAEEQQQFAGYWTGQARAALEAGRFEEADDAARKVLEKFPSDQDSAALLTEIATARTTAARSAALARGRDFLTRRQWQAASQAAQEILSNRPADSDALALQAEIAAASAKAAADLAQARSRYQQSLARDQGQFDQQALDWLREANSLAPEDLEITALFEKMASYTRTLRVPQDFPTPIAALAQARDRDRVILGEGTWKGPLIVNAAIELQGAGPNKTLIECPADAGCVVTLGPAAKGARLTGLTFRHQSQNGEAERFSAGLIQGATVELLDCVFRDACGHGLAVIGGGAAKICRCRFIDNGWNGAAAIGAGTALDIRESEASGNFEHGLESWDGASLTAIANRCDANSRNGIHADNPAAAVVIEDNQLRRNREFGVVLSGAGSGQVRNNTVTANLLGGMVIRRAAPIAVSANPLRDNRGPGLTLERGLDPAAYRDNPLSGNTGKAILADFDFLPGRKTPPP